MLGTLSPIRLPAMASSAAAIESHSQAALPGMVFCPVVAWGILQGHWFTLLYLLMSVGRVSLTETLFPLDSTQN